jgi:cyanobactin cluster PatC/TenC/TruC protein
VGINTQKNIKSVLSFDGVDDRVLLSKPIEALKERFSIEFWANGSSNLTAHTSIFEAHDSRGNRILNVHLPFGGNIYWDAGNESGYDRIYKPVQAKEYKNAWSHWAFVKDCSTGEMNIYRNGELWHTGQGNNRPLIQVEKFSIGSYVANDCYWSGLLSEFRIWSVALTPAEIQANMHYRLSGRETGLVVYLPFNQGEGNTVKDEVSNGNYGQISGATWVEEDLKLAIKPVASESEVLSTGLQDYGYWQKWKQSLSEKADGKPFRRGRIWA